MRLHRFGLLAPVEGLIHACTYRGVDLATADGRSTLAGSLGFPELHAPVQVHGAGVVVLDEPWSTPPRADAVIVRRPGLLAGVRGADCPLLLLVDPRRRALALVHSGWRGTVAGVVPAAVEALTAMCGSRARDLLAAVGPSICSAHYEVGPEVVAAVEDALPGVGELLRPTREGHARLDLARAIAAQLEAAGVAADAVERLEACTW